MALTRYSKSIIKPIPPTRTHIPLLPAEGSHGNIAWILSFIPLASGWSALDQPHPLATEASVPCSSVWPSQLCTTASKLGTGKSWKTTDWSTETILVGKSMQICCSSTCWEWLNHAEARSSVHYSPCHTSLHPHSTSDPVLPNCRQLCVRARSFIASSVPGTLTRIWQSKWRFDHETRLSMTFVHSFIMFHWMKPLAMMFLAAQGRSPSMLITLQAEAPSDCGSTGGATITFGTADLNGYTMFMLWSPWDSPCFICFMRDSIWHKLSQALLHIATFAFNSEIFWVAVRGAPSSLVSRLMPLAGKRPPARYQRELGSPSTYQYSLRGH